MRDHGCIDYYFSHYGRKTVVSAQFLYTICDVNNGDTSGGEAVVLMVMVLIAQDHL
jgi:hypothetical protein